MDDQANPTVFSGNQRHYLRGLAHALKPVVQIGHAGLTDGVVARIDAALETHELIKVRLGEQPPAERRAAASDIERAGHAAAIQVVGRVLVLYRRRASKPDIVLPPLRPSDTDP
jgi:RNA-binding protein